MKKSLSLLAFLLLLVAAQAQQKTVAVYVTGEQSDVSKILGDRLVEAFSKSSDYKAVERTSSFLAEISKEQNYQRTGAVDDKEISRIGKQFGVQYVCVTDISEAFGKKYVSARLINVENAEIINSANEYSELNSMEELIRVSDALNSQLLGIKVLRSKVRSVTVVAAGYTDLGLPSGTIWKNDNCYGHYTYDQAVRQFGDRLPTKEQFEELKSECSWSWTGNGYRVTGPNGNSITLPAEGFYGCNVSNFYERAAGVGEYGCYWSSTPDDSSTAWCMDFYYRHMSGDEIIKRTGRCGGFSVRLVQE